MNRLGAKSKWLAIATAIATAASPGAYSVWQTAKQEYIQRREQTVRDKQSGDFQKHAKSIRAELNLLSKSCVTHRELLELVLRLREERQPARRRRPYSRVAPAAAPLAAKLKSLATKATAAKTAQGEAKAAKKRLPTLQPAQQIRQQYDIAEAAK